MFYDVTTSEDPIIERLAVENAGDVYATGNIHTYIHTYIHCMNFPFKQGLQYITLFTQYIHTFSITVTQIYIHFQIALLHN